MAASQADNTFQPVGHHMAGGRGSVVRGPVPPLPGPLLVQTWENIWTTSVSAPRQSATALIVGWLVRDVGVCIISKMEDVEILEEVSAN